MQIAIIRRFEGVDLEGFGEAFKHHDWHGVDRYAKRVFAPAKFERGVFDHPVAEGGSANSGPAQR